MNKIIIISGDDKYTRYIIHFSHKNSIILEKERYIEGHYTRQWYWESFNEMFINIDDLEKIFDALKLKVLL